ncbi:MAG: sigma-54-dependent Fis family transcriptional regulator [Ignavibacteriales bacterium]|nr:sigma-54-dependent Fis family transcriptional regulator [Ignavibacteriales bacterium]
MKQLIGDSKAIQSVRKKVDSLARSGANVIITGEPGTGKSVVAECIHLQSSHSAEPFALLNLATVDELKLRSIVRAILSKRRFVNPTTSGHGNFDLSAGATLILDELDRSTLPAQNVVVDLINGILEKQYVLRLIVLLNGRVKELVKEGRLLSDFKALVKSWDTIEMPSLRDRQEDIPELIEYFVNQTAKEMDLGEVVIDVNAISILVRKDWKGNVQELKTFVEQAMMLSDDKERFMLPESLIDEQSELNSMLERIDAGIDFALDRSMELIEKRILERVLKKFEFNQSRAARFLKITEDTLRYRMKKLGIRTLHEG